MIRKFLYVPSVLFLFLSVSACSRPEGIHPLTYVLFPALRSGNERPTKIENFSGSYNPISHLYELEWSISDDPDTNSEVPVYRLYIYYQLPIELYRPGNLYFETPKRSFPGEWEDPRILVSIAETYWQPYIDQDVYFIVTGFDGQAESLPSETLTVWTGASF